jgi:hypothetical protein
MIRRPCFYRRRGRVERLMIALLTAASLACTHWPGDDHPPVYPVKGKVLYKGHPIVGGVVVYEFDEGEAQGPATSAGRGSLRATGRIEPDGSFRLVAFPGAEGVPEGRYRVGISSMPPRTEGGILDSARSATKGNPDVLRGRYADPKTSGLHAEVVKDAANEPTFDLK